MKFKLHFSLWFLVLGIIGIYSDIAEARLCRGAPDDYVIEEIRGKVVDEDTGQPIEGAIVVAFWKTIQPRLYLKVEESITDSNGEFFFQGWGPVKRPDKGCFWDEDPLLSIFKSRYYTWKEHNNYYGEQGGSSEETLVNPIPDRVRKSRYNNKTIKLRKFEIGAEIERYSVSAGKKTNQILTEQDWCHQIDRTHVDPDFWHKVPHLLEVLKQQKKLHPKCNIDVPLSKREEQ